MDAFLAAVSRREVREYAARPIPVDAERRILETGRLAGNSKNRQQRRFVVVRDPARVEQVAGAVYEPANVRGAALVVAVVIHGRGPTAFDAGRAAQNMMLVAWGDGIGSTPNGIADADAMARALDLGEEERAAIVLSFGYPARPRDPEKRSPDEWIARADRLPYDEIVTTL
jgi:nitroreductase